MTSTIQVPEGHRGLWNGISLCSTQNNCVDLRGDRIIVFPSLLLRGRRTGIVHILLSLQ